MKSLSAARQAKSPPIYRGAIEYSCLVMGKNYAIRIGGKNNYAPSEFVVKTAPLYWLVMVTAAGMSCNFK
ncbi:MAG: hypothetical protein R3C24_01700 [Cyanobacteriota/Melainabacteria group bacterium]